MENQKPGNTNIFIALVVIAGVIGLLVYYFMKAPERQNEQASDLTQIPVEETTTEVTTQTKESPAQIKSNTTTKPMEPTNKKVLANFKPVSSVTSLQKIDTVVGTGAEVKAGDTVSVHYTGAVAATGEIFQSSKDFGTTPITFPLANVIKGWTDGIPGMKIGGTRRLIIPAAQAYGANPPGGSGIPANADLVFDVELIAIK